MYARTKLKVALTFKFDLKNGTRIVNFEKGDTILLWRRFWQTAAPDVAKQLGRNGFYVLHSSQSEDHEYVLMIAEPDRRLP
jgi:hypothetical protein